MLATEPGKGAPKEPKRRLFGFLRGSRGRGSSTPPATPVSGSGSAPHPHGWRDKRRSGRVAATTDGGKLNAKLVQRLKEGAWASASIGMERAKGGSVASYAHTDAGSTYGDGGPGGDEGAGLVRMGSRSGQSDLGLGY